MMKCSSIFPHAASNFLEAIRIVNSTGHLLNQNDLFSIKERDYIVCQPLEPTAVIPKYVWIKSEQIVNENGPNLIQNPNEEDGTNR